MTMRFTNEEENPIFNHFSHEHPLEQTNVSKTTELICTGCRVNINPIKGYYKCKICTFSLHSYCYKMPRKIHHPAHPPHDLILNLSHSFECKACGDPAGSGFSYTCQICLLNYHSLCTVRPLSKSHYSHPHKLTLEFSSPYKEIRAFRCDICHNPGLDHWLYRCGECNFDVHLDCTTSNQKPQTQITIPSNNLPAFEASIRTIDSTSITTPRSSPSPTYYVCNYSNGVQPYGTNFDTTRNLGNNQAVMVNSNGMPLVEPLPINRFSMVNSAQWAPAGTMVSPMAASHPQLSPGVIYVNQGSNYPNGVQPNGSMFSPTSPQISNQAVFVTPNGMPITTLNAASMNSNYIGPSMNSPQFMSIPNGVSQAAFFQQNRAVQQTNQGFGYGNQMSGAGSNQSAMSGMKGLVIGAVASGIGQQLGQEIFHGVTNGWGDGSGSSNDGEDSEIFSSWFGDSDYY